MTCSFQTDRRHLLAAFCLAAMLAATTGCSSGSSTEAKGTKRIIFLINTPDRFWDTCEAGLHEGAKEFDLAGSELTVVMDRNNGTAEGQIDKLRQYALEKDVVAVAVSAVQADNPAIADEMKNLMNRGKKVITVDGDLNREKFRECRSYYIGTDNVVAGGVLGKAARTIMQDRKVTSGGYVQFAGYTDNDNARGRMNGFKDAVGEDYTELDRMPDRTQKEKARDNVRDAMTKHRSELVALVGIWAYNAPAIAETVAEQNAVGKYTIATFDADVQAIKEMGAGHIDVMVVQNPFDMGRMTVKLLKAMHLGDDSTVKEMFPNAGQPDGDVFTTGLRVVVPGNNSPLKPELFDPKVVEFMTLTEFQEWLKKYKLVSS